MAFVAVKALARLVLGADASPGWVCVGHAEPERQVEIRLHGAGEAMDVSAQDIQAMVLGGHGDTMVPLVSYTTVSGIPVSQLLEKSKLDAIVDRTRNGGAEIVAFLKTGSAYYAPSAAAIEMVEAIALDRKRLLPCSAWLQGEFGLRDVFCGVPCKLGRRGLEAIVDIRLTDQERADLHRSAEAVRTMQTMVDG